MIQRVFRRKETKYLLTPETYKQLLWLVEPYLAKDQYFKNTNCNLYFDDEHNSIAVQTLEKPLYKEKIRLRSYGVPTMDDTVFLEIKKKYNGIGGKRRVPIKLKDFYSWLNSPKTALLSSENPQISAELKYLFDSYNLRPTLYLAYDRTSYVDRNDPHFRVTFDRDVRSRTSDLNLESGDQGESFFSDGEIIMEAKAENAYPLWFVRALSKLKIYPTSFSKYGRTMKRLDESHKIIYERNIYV